MSNISQIEFNKAVEIGAAVHELKAQVIRTGSSVMLLDWKHNRPDLTMTDQEWLAHAPGLLAKAGLQLFNLFDSRADFNGQAEVQEVMVEPPELPPAARHAYRAKLDEVCAAVESMKFCSAGDVLREIVLSLESKGPVAGMLFTLDAKLFEMVIDLFEEFRRSGRGDEFNALHEAARDRVRLGKKASRRGAA